MSLSQTKSRLGLDYWLRWREKWAALSPADRARWLVAHPELDDIEPNLWVISEARDKQLPPPGDWSLCMWLTGRGWGKTRCGSEWVRLKIESGECKRMALVAPTAADARDVMVEGESGILAVCPPWNRPDYEPSKRRLTWPNGAMATTYSADEPERLRGPQHDGAWVDELAAWRYPEAWDMLMFGLRLGANPQCAITTTPKPRQLIRRILEDKGAVVIRGSTYENRENLAPAFFSQIVKVYEGTTLGRQELYGEVLSDIPGAMWQREAIRRGDVGPLQRIVVAIDPAVTSNEDSDETGIIVAGKLDDRFYVLDDLSGRYTPDGWARKAVGAYRAWKADRIIGEVNNGGDMIEATLRQIDANVSYKSVRASRGKAVRAEPIAALYEQGRAIHVGAFNELEDQLCSWTSDSDWSPDRLDAMVWAATDLMLGEERAALVGSVDL